MADHTILTLAAVMVVLAIIMAVLSGKGSFEIRFPKVLGGWRATVNIPETVRGWRQKLFAVLVLLLVLFFLLTLQFIPEFFGFGKSSEAHATATATPMASSAPADPQGNWCTLAERSPKEWKRAAVTVPAGLTADDPHVTKIWYRLDFSQEKLLVQIVAEVATPPGAVRPVLLWSVHRGVEQVAGTTAYWPQKQFTEYVDHTCWRTVPSALGAAAYKNAGYVWPYAIVKASPSADSRFTQYLDRQKSKAPDGKQNGIDAATYTRLPTTDLVRFSVDTGATASR